jgi:hypothetical protein
MTKEEFISKAVERSKTFIKDAQLDIRKISEMQSHIVNCLFNNQPLSYSVVDSEAKECKNIYIMLDTPYIDHTEEEAFCVLDVINYYTFPVTAILDSISLSKKGKLTEALDIRPFMFSGPAPTQIIWSGSDISTVKTVGYPSLTNEDAVAAFKHWIHYVFGLHLNIETGYLEDSF